MEYILSVVIPTKNRQEYCLAAVKQIVGLGLKGLQIVVQDNSDDDELKSQLEFINCDDIKYNYHPGILSFVDNFSEAVENADGEYICMIGDDDGVLPNIMDVTESARQKGYDAVIPGLNSVYLWPSKEAIVKDAENGYLCISYLNSGEQRIDPEKELLRLLNNAGQDYQKVGLPRVYHGIVKSAVLEKIKNKAGVYFGGLTPDIYIAVALCFVCENVRRINYPITVSGICPQSGSSDSATGRHTGNLKDAPHFRGHDTYNWIPAIPEIYSVESIWAETVMHALEDFERQDLIEEFDIKLLDAICLNKYPQFSAILLQHGKEHGYTPAQLKTIGRLRNAKKNISRLKGRLFRKDGDVIKLYGISDICAASSLTCEEMRKKGIWDC